MYEYTDKIIRYMNKRFIRIFNRAKVLTSFDELHVFEVSREIYSEINDITVRQLLKLARYTYKKHRKKGDWNLEEAWLLGLLDDYDPVTKYVYVHEVDRKRARFAESVIASSTKAAEIDKALRYWSQMANQYAITVTDKAAIKAYKDDGVKEVIWITTDDDRRCAICAGLDRKKFKIDSIPEKPHWGCRCYVIPVVNRQ